MDKNEEMQAWSQRIRAIGESRFKTPRTRLADMAQLMGRHGEKPSTGEVAAWLNGVGCARTTEQHSALMAALGMTETMRELPAEIDKGPRYMLAIARGEIEDLWEEIPEAIKQQEPIAEPTTRVRDASRGARDTSLSGAKKTKRRRSDHPAIPDREHQSSLGYKDLKLHELDRILQETPNCHEFVDAFVARYCGDEDMAALNKKLGYDSHGAIRSVQSAGTLPTHIDAWKQLIAQRSRHAELAEHFEDLVIENRLQIINHPKSSNHTIGDLYAFMPKKYWRYLLETEHGEHVPCWQARAKPIGCKGDYLRAVIGISDYTAKDIPRLLNMSDGTRWMRGDWSLAADKIAQLAALIPEFDLERYEQLPVGRSKWLHDKPASHVAGLDARGNEAAAARSFP